MKKILYSAGPGDIVQTYYYWKDSINDPTQVAITYSKQFYDLCKELNISGVAISTHPRSDSARDDFLTVYNKKTPLILTKGLGYHLGQIYSSLRVLRLCMKHKCKIAIISNYNDWYTLCLLKIFKIKIIPTLHCTFWTNENKPKTFKSKIIDYLNSLFWSHCVSATLCISPECERQLKQLCPTIKTPIYQARPSYLSESFEKILPAKLTNNPFCIVFAGRIEKNKGLTELYLTAKLLEESYPNKFKWIICGSGSFFNELSCTVNSEKCSSFFELTGHLDRPSILEKYSKSHIFIIPTRHDFPEGLNKVAIEGVLSHRPVIVSKYIPAIDILKKSVIVAEEITPECLSELILDLYNNPEKYFSAVNSTKEIQEIFFNTENSWKTALKSALSTI